MGTMMRRVFPVLLVASAFLASAPSGLHAEGAGTWSLHAEFDLYALGLKAGAEYRILDSLGVRGTFGINVISPLMMTYTLVGVQHFFSPDNPLQLDLEFGLIQASFNVLEPYVNLDPKIDTTSFYWVPGAEIAVGWCPSAGHVISLRVGAGCLFGYDSGSLQGPQFMPNIGLEYGLRLGK
jgi:hypothetical protein